MKKIVVFFVITILFLSCTTQAQISVYFSPNGGCENAVINQINKARSQILVAIYTFTEEEIAQALVNAKKNGIGIEVLMDKTQASGAYAKGVFLASKGIPVRYSTGQGLMHNKFAVIDTLIVITGSFNWASAA
jgi:phosphatidylserine/phosphatidylglycerophosphate/cardiolipin synthase-like enzyme